jgi:hypothetical protein
MSLCCCWFLLLQEVLKAPDQRVLLKRIVLSEGINITAISHALGLFLHSVIAIIQQHRPDSGP